MKKDGPVTSGIDASLFTDDDGTVYYVWQDGRIAKMNEQMNDIEGPSYLLPPTNFIHVGFEGAFLFKANGRYYLSCADVTGPPRPRPALRRLCCIIRQAARPLRPALHRLGQRRPQHLLQGYGGQVVVYLFRQ